MAIHRFPLRMFLAVSAGLPSRLLCSRHMHSLGMNRAWHILGSGQPRLWLSKVSSTTWYTSGSKIKRGSVDSQNLCLRIERLDQSEQLLIVFGRNWKEPAKWARMTPKLQRALSTPCCCFSICTVLSTGVAEWCYPIPALRSGGPFSCALVNMLHHWVKSQKGLKED